MRRRLLLGCGAVVVAGLAVVASAGSSALTAADRLSRAEQSLSAVRDTGTSTQEALVALRSADVQVREARIALDRWPVDVVAAVPVLGRSLRAERAVTATADAVVDGAVVLADALPAVRASAGGVDLDTLAELQADLSPVAQRSRRALDELEQVPTDLTPPQVSRAVRRARAALGPAVGALQSAERGLGLAQGLLGQDGPRSLLVMLQNNAELRGAGGYSSSFATGRTEQGRIVLEPLRDLGAVADPPSRARRVPAPPEYTEDFAEVGGDSTMWRAWNMSPHVPDAASVSARIAASLLGREPDVVVLLDVPAMGALAALGGEDIELPSGDLVGAAELTEALLVDAYAAAGRETEAQVERRAQLQAAATQAVSRLLTGGVSLGELSRTVADLAARRHLAVWSSRPSEQRALVSLGLAGAVAPADGEDISHVSVNNVGANKLDVYVDRAVELDVTLGPRAATVVQKVSFTNRAPDGLVPYVAGRDKPGTVISRVELSLPPRASGLTATVDGAPWPGELHTGGDRDRLLVRLELPRGASSVLEVRYALPLDDGAYRLTVVPQPLVEDAQLDLAVRPAAGERLGPVTGAPVEGGEVRLSGPLRETVELVVGAYEPSTWERVEQWWNSPLELG